MTNHKSLGWLLKDLIGKTLAAKFQALLHMARFFLYAGRAYEIYEKYSTIRKFLLYGIMYKHSAIYVILYFYYS